MQPRTDGWASMEPGHEDREYMHRPNNSTITSEASMEPGHEDREYMQRSCRRRRLADRASMEPGHEDREYVKGTATESTVTKPQWSPVMKTGNTRRIGRLPAAGLGSLNGARS